MRGLSTAALVAAWEDGMAQPAVDRAPALLRPLGLADCDPDAMTVGACDLLLLRLRGWLFGTDLDLVATCPACREAVELVIPTAGLDPAGPGEAGQEPGLTAGTRGPAPAAASGGTGEPGPAAAPDGTRVTEPAGALGETGELTLSAPDGDAGEPGPPAPPGEAGTAAVTSEAGTAAVTSEAGAAAVTGEGPAVARGGPRPVTLEEDGVRIRCRVPTNGDLRQLAALGRPVTLADLLGRCVESMEGPKAPRAVADLPAALAERLAGALAASDPGADIVAEIECPCGAVWAESIDIRTILWADLTSWVRRRLAEVHQLAAAYGWAERDILEMSQYRRRFYLEACAG